MSEIKKNSDKMQQKQKFRLDKRHIQGFIAGIILCGIAFAGLWLGTGGSFFTGTVTDLKTVNDTNFEAEVLNADRPVLVVVTANWNSSALNQQNLTCAKKFAAAYGAYCKVVTLDVDKSQNFTHQYSITTAQMLMLFAGGNFISNKTTTGGVDDLCGWIAPLVHWEAHDDSQKTSSADGPTLYNMFGSKSAYDRDDYNDIDVDGEIRLFAFDAANDTYVKCDGQTLTGVKYAFLTYQFPASINKNNLSVTVTDLTGAAPAEGVNYYVCTGGTYPTQATTTAAVVGEIGYFGHQTTSFSNFYVGEVKLIKDLDESTYAAAMVPCDGRALKIKDNQALYDKIGTTYGGDGTTTFCIPDLRGKSPLDGGQYYLMLQGVYMY